MRKNISLLLTGLLLLFSANSIANDITVINGKIINFDPQSDKAYIDLLISDIVKPGREQVKIADDGKFEFNIILKSIKEVELKYDAHIFSLILRPSDSIHLLINKNHLIDKDNNSFAVIVSGNTMVCNQLIQKNNAAITGIINSAATAFSNDISVNETNFKKNRLSDLQKQRMDLERLIAQQSLTDKEFITWAKAKVDFAAGIDLCFFPFLGRRSNHLSDTSDYFDFTNTINLKDPDFSFLDSYIKYVQRFAGTLEIICNVYVGYEPRRKKLSEMDSSPGYIPLYYERFKASGDKVGKNYLMACLFNIRSRYTLNASYLDSLKSTLSPDLYASALRPNIKIKRKIGECISDFDASESLKTRLKNLFQGTGGKVVYMDFWFSSCAPCMREFQHYNDLMNQAGGDVIFLFFGVYMNEEEWKNTIDKFGIKGKHFLLDKNEVAFFEKYFELRAYPHHAIISKDGTIEMVNTPTIYDYSKIPAVLTAIREFTMK